MRLLFLAALAAIAFSAAAADWAQFQGPRGDSTSPESGLLRAVGHTHCRDRKNGAVVWARDLWRNWLPSGEKGYVFSPLVVDGILNLWLSDGASDTTKKDVLP